MPATNVYYEMTTKHLDTQLAQVDSLDAKVATLFAASSAILAIFAGLLSLSALPASNAVKVTVFVVLGLACLVYILLLIFLFLAYQVGTWDMRPHIDDLQANCAEYDEQQLQEWVADECARSLKHNAPLLDRKADFVNRALTIFPVEALLLVVAGAITLLAR